MITFKINKKAVSIPLSWDEVTYKAYCEILNSDSDTTALLSIFTGIDCETLKKAKVIGLEDLITVLSFTTKPPKIQGYYSEIGAYKLPKNKDGQFNIQFESLAQFEDMRSIFKKLPDNTEVKDMAVAYGKVVAIYLQSVRDGEYNHEAAKQMVETEIYNMPMLPIISMGSFFFAKLLSLSTGMNLSYRPTVQTQKRSKQGTTSSRKHSGRTGLSRKRR